MIKSQSFLQREFHPNYWKVGSVVLSLINALFFSLLLYALPGLLFPSNNGSAGFAAAVAFSIVSFLFAPPLAVITWVFFRNYAKKQRMSAIVKLFFRIWLVGYLLIALYDAYFVIVYIAANSL